MSNDEILKAAMSEWSSNGVYIGPDLRAIERIYKSAYNAGIEAAASRVEGWTAGGNAANVIRNLEMR